MDDYIRREGAVKIAERYGLACGSVLGRHTGIADCIASEISGLPAADVAPVVHGQWLDNMDYMFCSKCGMRWNYCDNDTQDFKYCPNCVAKMDGDKEGK